MNSLIKKFKDEAFVAKLIDDEAERVAYEQGMSSSEVKSLSKREIRQAARQALTTKMDRAKAAGWIAVIVFVLELIKAWFEGNLLAVLLEGIHVIDTIPGLIQ